jgi:hypothetical protein
MNRKMSEKTRKPLMMIGTINRPKSGKRGAIGRANRPSEGEQHRDSPVGHRGMASPLARARTRSVETAWARRRHAMERGHVARPQPIRRSASELVLIRSSPYTLACTAKSASDATRGFIGRQPVAHKHHSFLSSLISHLSFLSSNHTHGSILRGNRLLP